MISFDKTNSGKNNRFLFLSYYISERLERLLLYCFDITRGTYRYLAAGGVAVGRLKLSLGAVGGSGAVAHHAQPTHHTQQQCP